MNLAQRAFSTVLAAALFAQPAAAQLTRIGAAAAVAGKVNAVAPNASVGRVIESGKTLYLNDHVTTNAAGHLQVLLLDESVFTLGPSSDMVLDEFVYDPNTHAGKVAANFVKGTFRFVTGKVARKDPEQMKIKLAVGTIGIRGSVGVVQTDANGSTIINAGAGGNNDAGESSAGIFASNNGQTTDLSRPGFGTTIGQGQAPAPASDMSGQLNTIMGNLAPGGAGGAGGQAGVGGAGGSAGDASGKNTAAGSALAGDSSDTNAVGDATSQTATLAAQQANGAATWQDLLSINQGTAFYFSGHSPISCGGACNQPNPVGALQLFVDFNARTYGGATAFAGPSTLTGSFIHIHNITGVGDTLQELIGSGGGSGAIPFGTSGPATFTLNSSNSGTYTGSPSGSFNGSVVTFQNANGVAAASAVVNLTFSGQNSSSQAVSASGTFTAPKY